MTLDLFKDFLCLENEIKNFTTSRMSGKPVIDMDSHVFVHVHCYKYLSSCCLMLLTVGTTAMVFISLCGLFLWLSSTGRYLLSGNQNGTVSVWDLTSAPVPQLNSDAVLPPMTTFLAHDNDTVNGLRCVFAFHSLFCHLAVIFKLKIFSLRFNGHFPGEPGLASVYWSKGWWKWWWQLEL